MTRVTRLTAAIERTGKRIALGLTVAGAAVLGGRGARRGAEGRAGERIVARLQRGAVDALVTALVVILERRMRRRVAVDPHQFGWVLSAGRT